MTEKINLAPFDEYASDREEAERFDLEMHARLEAGLIDTLPASDQPAPAVRERPSFWQAVKTMFN